MNILVLNGSPKGTKSNTYRITSAFLDGMAAELGTAANIEVFDVSAAHIEHCKGCFCCWTATPGHCVIHDDMDFVLPKIIAADVIIWSFPLYYYGMPSKLKALLDRNLPLNLPFIEKRADGGCDHPGRYGKTDTKHILISTCGFYSTENNYNALLGQFDILYGNYQKIICPEGELFAQPELKARTDEYLAKARQAGTEYAKHAHISNETMQLLDELLYPPDAFIEMANASWDIRDGEDSQTNQQMNAAERFTKQMAATYNPASFDGTERVFEIYYTDVQVGYQLVLGKERCTVRTTDFTPFLTKVETPLSVWQDIAKGVYNGAQAMMEGKYKTTGDLKFLMAWERYFGGASRTASAEKKQVKKSNMTLMLTLWMSVWTLLPIHAVLGGIVGICLSAGMHFADLKWKLTIYDRISCVGVSIFSLLALLNLPLQVIIPLSYLCFGLLWSLSCATKIPLSAHYSKNEYNGDIALENPLFLKTNFILSLSWGLLYLITPIWTYFIMCSRMPYLTTVVNGILPCSMGIFTIWFQRWYPAKIAAGQ